MLDKYFSFWKNVWDWRAVQRSVLCRSLREFSKKYLFAKIGFDTAEHEPCKVCPIELCNSVREVSNEPQRMRTTSGLWDQGRPSADLPSRCIMFHAIFCKYLQFLEMISNFAKSRRKKIGIASRDFESAMERKGYYEKCHKCEYWNEWRQTLLWKSAKRQLLHRSFCEKIACFKK